MKRCRLKRYNFQIRNNMNKENETSDKQQNGNGVLANVERSVSVDIINNNITTIEALHDLLLDAHGYSLDFIALKRARELTAKMYKAFD